MKPPFSSMKFISSIKTTKKKHINIIEKGKHAIEYHTIGLPVSTLKLVNNKKKGNKYEVCPNALNKISDINDPK